MRLAGCAVAPEPTAVASDRAAPAVPIRRLSGLAVPRRYRLHLDVDPTAAGFAGDVTIDVDLARSTRSVWLHAALLDITSAFFVLEDGTRVVARIGHADTDGATRFDAPAELPAGRVRIELAWRASFADGYRGLYTLPTAAGPLAVSTFEPVAARRAFPSFDEPRFKTPFEVSLTVPLTATAISNAAAIETLPLASGRKRVRFAVTRPLPTYLVALAVGPLDTVTASVPANRWRERPLRLRGIAVRGAVERMDGAMAETRELVEALEDWFAVGFPYDKLDVVAIPGYASAALEHAGAIFLRDTLVATASAGPRAKRLQAVLLAHEIAHQWFGNAVTMPWWDDLWLKEAFATWLSFAIVDRLRPRDAAALSRLNLLDRAIDIDALDTAPPLRRAVTGADDIVGLFDPVTYQKGAAVIGMVAAYAGADRFRDMLREHVRKHLHGTADTGALLDTLVAADPAVAGVLASFIALPGMPAVEVRAACDGPRPEVRLRQTRYIGLPATPPVDGAWQVPVCLDVGTTGGRATHCQLLDGPHAQFELPGLDCRERVHPNAGYTGYYQFMLPPAGYAALLDAPESSPLETLAVVASVERALDAGTVSFADVAALAPSVARSSSYAVSAALLPMLRRIDAHWLDAPAARAAFRDWSMSLYSHVPTARLFDPGFLDGRASDAERLYLAALGEFIASVDGDAAMAQKGARAGARLLDDTASPGTVPHRGSWSLALQLWLDEDGRRIDTLLDHPRFASDPTLRRAARRALGKLTDPQAGRRLRNRLTGATFRDDERRRLIANLLANPAQRAATWRWLVDALDRLRTQMPARHLAKLPAAASEFCDTGSAIAIDTVFAALATVPGARLETRRAVAMVRQCAAQSAHIGPAVREYFAARKLRAGRGGETERGP